tara:strand:- start:1017 stop:1607 length:591 start_codon:yes stop_codon:yes gene_type:complete
MAAVYVNNISIDSGEDWSQDYTLYETGGKVIDLSGYRAKAQIRKHPDSNTSIDFSISFPSRTSGVLNLSIARWTSSLLKPGRYVYDVMIVKEDNKKEIVIEGSALVRAGITTDSSLISPSSTERTCIAVIDDSSKTFTDLETTWNTFRSSYPNRTFYLLQPTAQGFGNSVGNTNYDSLKCPDKFVAETTVNISPLI